MDNINTDLIKAIKKGATSEIKQCLKKGANPNYKDALGQNSLVWSINTIVDKKTEMKNILTGRPKIIFYETGPNIDNTRLLLEAGANPNSQDKSLKTPLMEAANKDLETVKLLISYKANPNIQAANGTTALMLATNNVASKEIAKYLIDSGADVNLIDNSLKTALTWATEANNLTVIKALIKAGANINHQDQTGRTAIMWAVLNEYLPTIRLLIELGADINIRDNDNNSALSLTNNKNILEILNNAKSNPQQYRKIKYQQVTEQLKLRNTQKQRKFRQFIKNRKSI